MRLIVVTGTGADLRYEISARLPAAVLAHSRVFGLLTAATPGCARC